MSIRPSRHTAGPGVPVVPREPGAALPGAALPRLRRRRRLLLGSAPVALLAVLLAVKLLSLPVSAGQAASAYGAGNADGTVQAGQAMGVLNLVERWKAPFALGDGHVLHGDFEAARTEFSRALELVPADESCRVRVNLVLSLEKLGEARDQAGDPASGREFYARGSEVIAQAPRGCFAPNSGGNRDGEGEALSEARERLAQKQQGGGAGSQDQPQDDGGSPSAEPPPASKLEQLEKSGQEAQQERSKSRKLHEDFAEADPEPYAKPW